MRKDRDFGRKKGGVILGFKDDLIVTPRPDLSTNCELVWASIQIQGSKQIFVGSFYRSQQFSGSTEYMDLLRASLNKIDRSNSKPRLLNLILLNLIVRWPMGAAIVRPPNTEYTQRIGACWEKLPKIVKITLLQFNYEFGHGNFFTV